jgi:hypothetical protein
MEVINKQKELAKMIKNLNLEDLKISQNTNKNINENLSVFMKSLESIKKS